MLERFIGDNRGNVAMMFGLCALALIGLVGLSIDFVRQQTALTRVQGAVDQVALSLALQARKMDAATIQAKATDLYLAATGAEQFLDNTVIADMTGPGAQTLRISAKPKIVAAFGGLFGVPYLPVAATATVPVRSKTLEIALVLDNTGSMLGQNKLAELKKASKALVDIIKISAAATGNEARIAIVPFATSVNIGTASSAQPWLDWSEYPNPRVRWNGCVEDRSPPFDTKNTIPDGDAFTWYPTVDCNVQTILPLTDNWNSLNQKLDSLNANGNTNLTIGVAWGYNMLTYGAPLSTAASPTPDILKYMIVLTDGVNTQNRWTTDPTQIDSRTRQACENARSIAQVYTIRVINGSEALIRECASSSSMFYDITSASQLTGVFQAIAKQMTTSFYLSH